MRIPALLAIAVLCAPAAADEIWVSNEKDDTLSSTLYKNRSSPRPRNSACGDFFQSVLKA